MHINFGMPLISVDKGLFDEPLKFAYELHEQIEAGLVRLPEDLRVTLILRDSAGVLRCRVSAVLGVAAELPVACVEVELVTHCVARS